MSTETDSGNGTLQLDVATSCCGVLVRWCHVQMYPPVISLAVAIHYSTAHHARRIAAATTLSFRVPEMRLQKSRPFDMIVG